MQRSSSGGSESYVSEEAEEVTEQQAELLAGQFGGLRITALETLAISRRQLDTLNAIQANTGIQISKMMDLLAKFNAYETGQKKLYVQM